MELNTLATILKTASPSENAEFQSVSTDSRSLQKGDLFFALSGPNFDGHDFLEAVEQAGAVAAVVSHEVSCPIPTIKVADTRKALGILARYHRVELGLPVIAITGSCGKTTTRALVEKVLSQAGHVLASVKSYNNDIGVPLTLLRLNNHHQSAVIEIGANHPGEIAYLTQIAKPNIALITNAAEGHLEGFGNVEGVSRAKGEIFQGLDEAGIAIINHDDFYADYWRSLVGSRQVISFAIEHDADVMAKDVTCDDEVRATFCLQLPNGAIDVTLQLIGEHNVMNALAAAAVGYAKGLSVVQIKNGLEATTAVKRRLIQRRGYAGATVIDDTYNANPLSVAAAMKVLARRSGPSIFVLGDMLELGPKADCMHQQLGEKAKALGIDYLFCLGQHARHAALAFGQQGYHFQDHATLTQALKNHLQSDMTVLVKGSLGMQMDQIAKAVLE